MTNVNDYPKTTVRQTFCWRECCALR